MKIVHEFIIPVLSDEIKSFTQKDYQDDFHPLYIAEKCEAIITPVLQKFGMKLPRLFGDALQELLENSYDSYAKKGLCVGSSLQIKLVVKQIDTGIVVMIKDNGSGFPEQKKGDYFMIANIKPEHKDAELYCGGEGIGLNRLHNQFAKEKIGLFFKNRKETGAAVQLKFTPNNMTA
ncbi:ATP-binding protein [Legionella brunensis]|uniref:Histidine kinase/HSP90-like ATPase domain-containing protein n=1 Tax=Legionella brunensis TaxID=29422 RepID=A0A0W0S0I2_9GAMM|nr:ATP-binding protein [Legionella brunensis]KTC76956.1 hypothetical protein Lbru_3063 [Legionella brunensis]